MKYDKLILLAGFVILTGCATLNEQECRMANWRDIGIHDGRNGQPASRVETHRKACASYGILLQEQQYLAGREEGLQEYCRIDNAFRSGLNGQKYKGVCPTSIDLLFRRCNEAAYAIYQSREEIERLNRDSTYREYQLKDKKLTDRERDRLRNEIRDLDRKLSRLRDDLRHQERNLDDLMVKARDRYYPQ